MSDSRGWGGHLSRRIRRNDRRFGAKMSNAVRGCARSEFVCKWATHCARVRSELGPVPSSPRKAGSHRHAAVDALRVNAAPIGPTVFLRADAQNQITRILSCEVAALLSDSRL